LIVLHTPNEEVIQAIKDFNPEVVEKAKVFNQNFGF